MVLILDFEKKFFLKKNFKFDQTQYAFLRIQVTKTMNDSNINDLMKNNPRLAVAEILKKYGGALLGIITKIVGSKTIAEDTLQEASVKIWEKADTYDPSKGKLFTWLFNIVKNAALDKVRTQKFKAQQQVQSLEQTVYNHIKYSEEQAIKDVGLYQVLDQLDEKYRIIIDMIYLQGYTQQQVSEALDLPLGTVKSRVKAGIKKLRKILKATK